MGFDRLQWLHDNRTPPSAFGQRQKNCNRLTTPVQIADPMPLFFPAPIARTDSSP
jgi:hypothetical protein